MRKFLYTLFLCVLAFGASGQSYRSRMSSAIDMGTYTDFFTYTDTKNTASYANSYTHHFYDPITGSYYNEPPAREVFYKITIKNKSMQFEINDYGSSFSYGTRIYVLDAGGNEIAYGKPYDLSYNTFIHSLQPGTYYFVIEAATDSHATDDVGTIAINISAVAKPSGDDFFYPELLGTFHTNFVMSHAVDNQSSYIADYVCDFKDGSENDTHAFRRDLVHQFTISKPMEITLDNIGSTRIETMHSAYFRILSSVKDTIREESMEYIGSTIRKLHYELPPGTYYIYSKFSMDTYTDAKYVININGKEQLVGSKLSNPLAVGSKSDSFTFVHHQNTSLFNKNRDSTKPGKEVYYTFTITVPMEITVNNCGSGVSDTYLNLLSEEQHLLYANDDYTEAAACSNTQQAYINIPVLLPGTYYVMADGMDDGIITTSITGTAIGPMGDRMATSIDMGTHDAGFHFSDTQNTALAFGNQFNGRPTHDVFYKFALTQPMDIVLTHCGSSLADTYLTLLDIHGTVIYANDNYTGEGECSSTGNAVIRVTQLPIGTYYVVSEGGSQNGVITTNMQARSTSVAMNTTQRQPHVITIVPTVQTDSLETLSADQLQRSVQYYDHFGNPTVHIALDAAPFGGDWVSLQETDGFMRKSKTWLPIAKSTGGGQYPSPVSIQSQAKLTTLYGNDQRPYSQIIYDESPLGLVVEEYGPGQAWFRNKRAARTDRMTNFGIAGELACTRYVVGGSHAATTLKKTGFYEDNQLYVTKTIDEDNHISYEFKDKAGRTVLSRKMNGMIAHDTYYVYDNYGNLNFVLPPMASDALITTDLIWDDSNATLTKYAYIYRYDAYHRLIDKRLPGCEPVFYIYDKADRLIFSQDGVQRAKPTPEWTFIIPDAFGRTVLTGICSNSLSYLAAPLANVLVRATYTGGTNAFKGYTISDLSLHNPTVLTANYYDDYTFLNTNGINNAGYLKYGQTDLILSSYTDAQVEASGSITLQDGFHVPEGANFLASISGSSSGHLAGIDFADPHPSAKGLLTGTISAQLEPGGMVNSDYLFSVNYYDNRGRLIQVADKVPGGTKRITNSYDFAGKALFLLEDQSVQGIATEILTAYTYDRAGRQITETITINGLKQTSVTNQYDQIGRLASTQLAKGNWSDTETASYNIRGWLTGKSSANFSMQLRYQDVAATASDQWYGGNISEWSWRHGNGIDNMYSFKYDGLSRLTGAQQYVTTGPYWTEATNHYTEKGINYDKQGNILTLERFADGSKVDDLSYTYNGNQLITLNESVNSPGALDVLARGANAEGTYGYDGNGNTVNDSRKNLTYGHNFLNLIDEVKEGQTVRASYRWSASGTKLGVRSGDGSNGFDYVGSVIYSLNGQVREVEAVHFSHGVVRKQADGYMVNYFLKDHLGSTRVVLNGNGEVLEQNDYYPFGAGHKRNDYLSSDNRFRYNRKEEQVVGNIGLQDYGARFYDPVIGRWNVVDALADEPEQIDKSPYAYTWNNPVNLTDPDGNCPQCFTALAGALIGGGVELAGQLLSGKSLKQVDWADVGVEALKGGLIGSGAGAIAVTSANVGGVVLKASVDLSMEDGTKTVFNGTKSKSEAAFDAGADVIGGKIAGAVGKKITAATTKGLESSIKAEVKASKTVIQAQNAFNKVTDGGKNMSGAKSMIAAGKLDVAKSTSQVARQTTVGAKIVNTVSTGAAGNVVKNTSQNTVVDKIKGFFGF